MGIFDVIGGRPEGAPERAFDVGERFGQYRQLNSAGAKLQGVMDAYQKGIETRQANKINEGKVRKDKIIGILQEAAMAPEGSPQRMKGTQLAQTLMANPAFMASLEAKTGSSSQLSPEQKRSDYVRKSELDSAEKVAGAIDTAENALNSIDEAFQKAIPDLPENEANAIYGGTGKALAARLGFGNPNLRSYMDSLQSLSTAISKGLLGEVGVLTDKDREVAVKALPKETDSVTVYNNKMLALRGIIKTAKQNYANKRQAYLDGVDFQPAQFSQDRDMPSNSDIKVGATFQGKKILKVTPYEGA